jgi:glycosyltransferase involved in cell wall biosynthesis
VVTGRASDQAATASAHHVCLIVPNGTHRPDALADAIAMRHPDVQLSAVWCGDPSLRPPPAGRAPWVDGPGDPATESVWHDTLISNTTEVAEWLRALRVVRSLVVGGARSVTLMWVGAIAVLDDVAAVWAGERVLRLVPRVMRPLPIDGLRPEQNDLLESGLHTARLVTFGPDCDELIDWLERRLTHRYEPDDGSEDVRPQLPVGRSLDVAATLFGADVCADERIGVGMWRWSVDRPALLDVSGFDTTQPWVLDPTVARRSRITVVGHPDRQQALSDAAPQLAGRRLPLTAPGGIVIDGVMRTMARVMGWRRHDSSLVPSPWLAPAAFRAWLGTGYWTALHASRRDLTVAFPHPTTIDAHGFRAWSRRASVDDQVAFLVPPAQVGQATTNRFQTADPLRADGLNLLGYLRRESSLGDVARRLATATAAAHVPTALLAHERTASPLVTDPPQIGRRIEFGTTLAVVNADQFMTIDLDHPELVAASDRMIAYWFWELEHVPPSMRAAFASVDEIWAGSQFVVDAFAAVAAVPVRHVPIPVARPMASARSRASFAPLARAGDRFVFTVIFDHFSVTERKNPVGAIQAFRRAFRPDEGPMLVVKAMNGQRRWPQHQQVLDAAGDRPDIIVWDEHLSRADHMAYITAVDALVSLHRSEGLGLHLAEAMWLDTPTIATRYSGNLDFMDDDCALLVDAPLINVERGEGVYPPHAVWADPDLDMAADAMRALAGDPLLHTRLAAAGRAKMEGQPSLEQTGRLIAELLELH